MGQLTRPRASIDLDALARNYHLLADRAGGRLPAGVVKADGYGLGAVPVARRLLSEGCSQFFVARLDEGLRLRSALATAVTAPEIYVLDGAQPGTEDELAAAGLVPILNDVGQIQRWQEAAMARGHTLPGALHFDTGMTRLGIPAVEADILSADPARLNGIAVELVMRHLASADEPGAEQSVEQLGRFRRLRARFRQGRASLANSAGTFLGPEYHLDLIRPGIALYGGAPLPGLSINPVESVVTVEVPVLQVQDVGADVPIGYGATYRTERATRVATIAAGYADGYHRAATLAKPAELGEPPTRTVAIGGRSVPVLGRISMDLIAVDVGGLRRDEVQPGTAVELLGPTCSLDQVAAANGTIANEVLTSLGQRYQRRYQGDPSTG